MAYDKIHGVSIVDQDVPRLGPSSWNLNTTDPQATVAANGYISDGGLRGMRAGDVVRVRNVSTTPPTVSSHEVLTVNANGSVDLSDGLALSTANAG